MKKIIYLLLFTLFSISVKGQNTFKPEWNVGIGGGITMASIDFQPGVDTKNISQAFGGVAIRYLSEKNLGLIAELNYSQVGWQETFKEYPNLAYSRTMNYVEMPFLTHIYFGNKVRFFINLGPKIGFLISESEKMNDALKAYLSSGEMSNTFVTHQYYRDAEKKFDYGIMLGGGLEFRTGVGNFALDGRYYFGLGDIYNSSKSDYFSRSAHRVISVKLTYFVKLF